MYRSSFGQSLTRNGKFFGQSEIFREGSLSAQFETWKHSYILFIVAKQFLQKKG